MNSIRGSLKLAKLRREAKELLQQLRSGNPSASSAALVRFRRLQSFCAPVVVDVATARSRARLKHALAVLAEESGAASWIELRRRVERESESRSADLWYRSRLAIYLQHWFVRYDEAKAQQSVGGGYLLPYRQHFFVCEADAIRDLGLDPIDPDWARIGFDAVRPGDTDAFARLRRRRLAAAEVEAESRSRTSVSHPV